jgi:hypothetical protein
MIKDRIMQGVKPTQSIKKKQASEAEKQTARDEKQASSGSRTFFRELAGKYEREGDERLAEVCRKQVATTCLRRH